MTNVMLPQPITRSADHIYSATLPNGEKVGPFTGVTTYLGILDKPALIGWAANETADAAIGMMDGDPRPLSHILDAIGKVGFRKAITSRKDWKRDEAAHLGTEVHHLAEGVINGEARQGSDLAMRHAIIYADWWKESGWTRPLTEVMGINPSVGYGGTADLMARDEAGKLVLADLKTGAKGVFREAVLQLQAYKDFTYIMVGGELRVMPDVDRVVILHVTLDGVRPIELNLDEHDRMAWLDCVDLWRWGKRAGRTGKL